MILISVIVACVVPLLLAYLFMGGEKNQDNKLQKEVSEMSTNTTGKKMIRASKILGYLGIAGLIVTGIIFIGPILSGDELTLSDIILITVIGTLFLVLSLYLIGQGFGNYYLYDDKKITFFRFYKKPQNILWSEITEIKYSDISFELYLIAGKRYFSIHRSYLGFKNFVKDIEPYLSKLKSWKPTVKKIESHKIRKFNI